MFLLFYYNYDYEEYKYDYSECTYIYIYMYGNVPLIVQSKQTTFLFLTIAVEQPVGSSGPTNIANLRNAPLGMKSVQNYNCWDLGVDA